MIKQDIVNTYIELFTRGEMLKGEKFINECIPLELQEDKDILRLRKECNDRMADIRRWNREGRPYPGTHAIAEFNGFPKFVLAKEKIELNKEHGIILDIGCYSAVFLGGMNSNKYFCWGVDIHKELVGILQKGESGGIMYVFANSENLPFPDGKFDVVTAFDILEHVVDLDKSILEIERVCKDGGLIIVNLPRTTPGYVDESFEHLRMFSDEGIQDIWGDKKGFKMYDCKDELGRKTWFFTYTK